MPLDAEQSRLAALLSRSALGDREAFANLYAVTRSKLFGVSLRIVRERPLAEEVLQDSFVNIWNHAADYAQAKMQYEMNQALAVDKLVSDLVLRQSKVKADELDTRRQIEQNRLKQTQETMQARLAARIKVATAATGGPVRTDVPAVVLPYKKTAPKPAARRRAATSGRAVAAAR